MKNIHKKEPLVLLGLLCSGLVLLAGKLGIVLDQATVQSVLEPLIVSLLGRPFVTPVAKVVDEVEKVADKVTGQ